MKKIIWTKKLISIIVVSVIVLLLILFALWRINFVIGQELRVTVDPEYVSITAQSPGTIELKTNIQVYNNFECEAECTSGFYDLSNSKLLDTDTFNSKAYKSKQYSHTVNLSEKGFGRDIYSLDVSCKNIHTTICPSDNYTVIRRSLTVVGYTPNSEELASKQLVETQYPIIRSNMINYNDVFLNSKEIVNENLVPFDTTQYYSGISQADILNNNLRQSLSYWDNYEYTAAKDVIVKNNLSYNSEKLYNASKEYYDYLNNTLYDYSLLFRDLNIVVNNAKLYSSISKFNVTNSNVINTTADLISKKIMATNVLVDAFNNRSSTYSVLYQNLVELRNSFYDTDVVLANYSEERLREDDLLLYVYSGLLCARNNLTCTNRTPNADYSNTAGYSNLSLSLAYDYLSADCQKFNLMLSSISAMNNISAVNVTINSSGNNSYDANNDSTNTLLLKYRLLLEYNSTYGQDSMIETASINRYLNDIYSRLNASGVVVNHQSLYKNFSSESIIIGKSIMLDDIKIRGNYCNAATLPVHNVIMTDYSMPPFKSFSENSLNISTLSNVSKKCCMYADCQSCDSNNISYNPLILLHGHSFNKDIYAYQSIDIFDGVESSLANDKIYYPVGTLIGSLGNNITFGNLGGYPIPVLVKPTYYIETYNDLLGLKVSESKLGNIDTYALRLKESIDSTLYVSGASKVDIVAHSMGGLVVRRYMQVFGTQNIGKVILIGTPNGGLSQRSYDLCKLFGAGNECTDMKSDSIFMLKLNDPSSQPKIDNMYLVIGRGCDTEGKDGDGVVSVDSALLSNVSKSNILYVNGSCSTTTFLHNEMLDVNKYPQVYIFLRSRLK